MTCRLDRIFRRTLAVLPASLLALSLVVLTHATPAQAQDAFNARIAVLDVDRILRDSLAAKSARPQVNNLRDDFKKQVDQQEKELRAADQELLRQRSVLAPEAFAQKRRALQDKAAAAQKSVQTRKDDLEKAVNAAMREVRNALIEVTADIAKERKLNLVIPKTFIVLSAKELDITEEALKRIDQKLKSVRVQIGKQ